jgi:SAM-dependent methyltransferase
MGLAQRVRGRMLRIRLALFRRIPPHMRGRVITRLTGWLAPAEMRWGGKPTWWDGVFESEDPFFFDSNPREALKYERTLELCGPGPFTHALEVGCAEGAFTERLAPRCLKLQAVDISAVAVQRASERTRAFPGVSCERRTLPAEFQAGAFDLIVASDVLYYLSLPELEASLSALERALAPGGALVLVHYAPPMGAMFDGDEVHDLLDSLLRLDHTHAEKMMLDVDRYRFDRFDKPAQPT